MEYFLLWVILSVFYFLGLLFIFSLVWWAAILLGMVLGGLTFILGGEIFESL